MALMDSPKKTEEMVSSEEATESAVVASLEEGDDFASENRKHAALVDHIEGEFRKSKSARQPEEERWLRQYRNYRGLYGPDNQFTETEKSRVFVKVTKTKVLAAYAQVTDVMFAGGKFPVGYEARKNPVGVAGEVHYDPKQITEEKVKKKIGGEAEVKRTYSRPEIENELGIYKQELEPVHEELTEGPGKSPSAMTWEPAKAAARDMEYKVHDQLGESDADKHLRMVAFESCLFGTGVMKGPFAFTKEYARWNEEGKYDPVFETIPKIEARSIWNIYLDPESRILDESNFVVDRHRMSKHQMRKLKKRPHFRKESIEEAIEMGPNYVPEYWEAVLEDGTDGLRSTRYEVLEFWGVVDRETLEDAELDIPEQFEDADEIQVNAWICHGQILRLVMNPFTPTRLPYQAVPYEMNPYSPWGVGIAENMEDTQILMNGFMRMSVDNAALSGNLLIEVDETNLVPGQDMSVYPGKVFRRQAGAPGQAIFGTKFPNVSNELLQMFDKSRQLADESTGMPSYSHGMTGVTGVGRTAAGMSMLMGASATNIKSVVRNFDDYLLTPLGKAFFAFNMQFNFDKAFTKGDIEAKARGTESLMRNEVRSQRLLQFMQMTANPAMQPFIKYDYILRELAASMDLDEEKILNDQREAVIQAKMMAEIQALMPQPAGPQGQGGEGGPPAPSDPTGNGNGNIAPGAAPEPGAAGFSGGGGGANGGNPAPAQGGNGGQAQPARPA